jgi:hypothetical protein
MTIEVGYLSTKLNTETSVFGAYQTCQNPMTTPSRKDTISQKIVNWPQIRNSRVELLFLITIVHPDSFAQKFQVFNQWSHHHIDLYSRMIQTMYYKAQENKFIFHAKSWWKVV